LVRERRLEALRRALAGMDRLVAQRVELLKKTATLL
jgi:hypothetical protein